MHMPSQRSIAQCAVLMLGLIIVLAPPAYAATTAGAGKVTEYQVPYGYFFPSDILTGPDGNLWFANESNNYRGYLARMTPRGHVLDEYPVPQGISGGMAPIGATANGDLWLVTSTPIGFGYIDPHTGQITLYTLQNTISG